MGISIGNKIELVMLDDIIRNEFKGYVEVPVKFENEGAKIVHYTPEIINIPIGGFE